MTAKNQPVFVLHAEHEWAMPQAAGFHQWLRPDGMPWAIFSHINAGYLVQFPDLVNFEISIDGAMINAYPIFGVSPQTVEHLYLNQIYPLALSRQFKLVLHGGAVELGANAVAFLGMSGRGKSTLTASFSTNGYRFLTDDGLQLAKGEVGYLAQPSHPSIRLWDDSGAALIPDTAQAAPPVDYTPKSRFLADDVVAYCNQPRPLRAVYFLGEGHADTVSIDPISGRDAMIELVKHSFLLDIEAREMLTHHFGQLVELVKTPMFFRLDYPRQYEMLPEVREAVIRHAANL